MHTSEELADKIVAFGIGKKDHGYYELSIASVSENDIPISKYVKADVFVNDWRVTGAMVEKVLDAVVDRRAAWERINPQGGWSWLTKPIRTARTITEGCVKELEKQA